MAEAGLGPGVSPRVGTVSGTLASAPGAPGREPSRSEAKLSAGRWRVLTLRLRESSPGGAVSRGR